LEARPPGLRGVLFNQLRRQVVVAASTLALAGLLAQSARAQDVTFRFAGTITQYSALPWADITVGTPFVGTYTFSLATPNEGSIPQVGDYMHRTAPYGVFVFVGNHIFRTDPNAVQLLMELVDN